MSGNIFHIPPAKIKLILAEFKWFAMAQFSRISALDPK
jgi:hypothetical protein